MATYGNESIRQLTDHTAVRKNPAQYAGRSDKSGAFTTVREIVSNSIDEFKARLIAERKGELEKEGFNLNSGTKISITYNADNTITVKDNGRGVPLAFNNKEQEYNYVLIYMRLNAGGKFDKEEENSSGYDFSIGLHGVGSALTVLSSSYAKVTSIRDGKQYEIAFEEGEPVGDLVEIDNTTDDNGTTVQWIPSLQVFDENDLPKEWFTHYAEEQAIVNKGLTIEVKYKDDEPDVYYYENGIVDYVKECSEKSFTTLRYLETDIIVGRDRKDRDDYRSRYEIAYLFDNENPRVESYHNSSYLKNGGSPHEAIRLAFRSTIDKKIEELNLYEKKEEKISFDDIMDSLIVVTNSYSTHTAYENQTKFAITNLFIKTKMTQLIRDDLEIYFTEFADEAEKICKQVLANKRSREKAEKTRLDVRKKLSGEIGTFSAGALKDFKNCSSKDKSKNILAICEGKSALSAMMDGRTKHHAIYPIRGKILNVSKAQIDAILENKEIMEIFKILGCGMAIGKEGSSTYTFDESKLNFDKIAIYVDADEDGMGSIFPLLLNVFWRLAPKLILSGRVYLGVTPKYEVATVDEVFYAMNDSELEVVKKDLGNKKYEIHYIKGLAELSAEGMEMSMSLERDNLIRIVVEDHEKSIGFLDTYMGSDIEPRQKLILESFLEEREALTWRV